MLPRVQLGRVAPQPWANHGGVTRELLRWPAAGEWWLRVSVAEVERDGPFSALPGIQRWFSVVAGAGVVLVLPEGRRLLAPGAPPLRFDGALAPACELVDGPTQDLNLMLRTSTGHGAMHLALPDTEWVSRAPWRGLYAADTMTLQIDDTDAVTTAAGGTLVYSDHGARQRWRLRPQDPLAARAWWLEFTPHAAASAP